MVLLTEHCAKILNCKTKSLRDEINHPSNLLKIKKSLIGRKAKTTYEDRNGFNKTVIIGEISSKGAESIQAYGKLAKPFNISVAAHFYARHRIKLQYPYLPCVIERFKNGGEDRYYPLELMELIEEETTTLPWRSINSKNYLGNIFKEIEPKPNLPKEMKKGEEEEEEEDEASWRTCCSQHNGW